MADEKTPKKYSKSQEYRFALYALWSATVGYDSENGKGMPFEKFYQDYMDKEIQKIYQMAEEQNNFTPPL